VHNIQLVMMTNQFEILKNSDLPQSHDLTNLDLSGLYVKSDELSLDLVKRLMS
jgi:hypothetical protein